ncbi:MAG TPA: hypothetical protein V6C58_13610 [Allocoleopsis sp.]
MTNSSDNLQLKVQIDLSLIAELKRLGIKHNPEKIIRIVKLSDGKIIFLEEGKEGSGGSGLKHILQEHRLDFSKIGIIAEQIPDLIINAIINGQVIGYQKTRSLTLRVIL